MATKDISDAQVIVAYIEYHRQIKADYMTFKYPYEILMETTGQCEKVCYCAMERANDRGYIDFGISLRTGWVTVEGIEYLTQYLIKK